MGVRCVFCGRCLTILQRFNGFGFQRVYSLREKLLRQKDKAIATWMIHDHEATWHLGQGDGFRSGRRVKQGVLGTVQTTYGILDGKIYLDDLPHDQHGCQLLTPAQINMLLGLRRATRKPINHSTRKRVLALSDLRCAHCGATKNLEIHHRKPVVHGGRNRLSNLVALCRTCHIEHSGPFSEDVWPDLEKVFLERRRQAAPLAES